MSCVLQSSHNHLCLLQIFFFFFFLAILACVTCAMAVAVYKLYYIEVVLSITICHISSQGAGREIFIPLYFDKNFLYVFITPRWEVHLLTFIVADAV